MDRSVMLAAICAASFLGARAEAGSERVIYAFSGQPDGAFPHARPLRIGNTFYGTTEFGGDGPCKTPPLKGCGTVFKVTLDGSDTVLHSFQGIGDGRRPVSSLAKLGDTLYGTTFSGGTRGCGRYGCGTAFSITPDGAFSDLHAFSNGPTFNNPAGGLLAFGGTLYGTTFFGGNIGAGSVFSVAPDGTFSVLYSFQNGPTDGSESEATLATDGTAFYGTSSFGGAHDNGAIFSVTPQGVEKVLYSFKGGTDGSTPVSRLERMGGAFYGTTVFGGQAGCGGQGCGTVFRVTPDGRYRLIYAFPSDGGAGVSPVGGLTAVNGVLYGTTTTGGAYSRGTIFSITKEGAETVLYSFRGGSDGQDPSSDLLYSKGVFYGTTLQGGGKGCQAKYVGCGTVFAFTP